MTSAKGNFDFFSNECVVGTALRVERMYFGGQLAFGEAVTLACVDQRELVRIIKLNRAYIRRQNHGWRWRI